MKIDVGCGQRIKDEPGCVGVDIADFGQEYIRDVEKGMPFANDSAEEIICEDTLEHLKDLIFVMNEFWRVLKPSGKLRIRIPDYRDEAAFKDPTHVRFFSLATLDYFERKSPRHSEYAIFPWKVLEKKTDGKAITATLEPVHKDHFRQFSKGNFKTD